MKVARFLYELFKSFKLIQLKYIFQFATLSNQLQPKKNITRKKLYNINTKP